MTRKKTIFDHMNPISNLERTAKEYVILALSLFGCICIFPFTIHRYVSHDWPIAIVDTLSMICMGAMFIYVYKTRKIEKASILLTALFFLTSILSVATKGSSQIIWGFPSALGIYYLISVKPALVLNILALLITYSLTHNEMLVSDKAAYVIAMIATNFFTVVFAMRNQIQKNQLEELTLKEPVTGVSNRRAFDIYLSSITYTPNLPLCMICLDIDRFKEVNDKHGQKTGDDTLIHLATLIQTQLHHGETLYRLNGAEYFIAPLQMSRTQCLEFAERLRKIIEHSNVNTKLGITVSLGVAEWLQDETAEQWQQRAANALTQAKRGGSNQTKGSVSNAQ